MKHHFLIVDTETTQDGLVADFAAVVVDRKCRIVNQCAVLVGGVFTDPDNHPLFFNPAAAEDDPFSLASRDRRYQAYQRMLQSGSRMIAGVNAINLWLGKAAASYRPVLTAYNLAFDLGKCAATGIDLTLFDRSFCLYHQAVATWAHSKAYRQMVLSCHAFRPPTKHGNMAFLTNAETMARFALGRPDLPHEPHTALEDVVFYELPILRRLLKRYSTRQLLGPVEAPDWRKNQVRDWFKPA